MTSGANSQSSLDEWSGSNGWNYCFIKTLTCALLLLLFWLWCSILNTQYALFFRTAQFCSFSCTFLVRRWVKVIGHLPHLNGRRPVCFTRWSFILFMLGKSMPHASQTRVWLDRSVLLLKVWCLKTLGKVMLKLMGTSFLSSMDSCYWIHSDRASIKT